MLTATIEGKKLVLTIDMTDPTPSESGKTLVVASSHGNVPTTAAVRYKGALYPITVGVNAFFRPPK